jgi:hypothetical protein
MSDPKKSLKSSAAATPATQDSGAGLENAAQVEELADHLSKLADAMHARIMRAIRKQSAADGQDAPAGQDADAAPGKAELVLSRTEAQAMFDLEVALRQHANKLYMDAAHHTIAGLQASQQSLHALASAAKEKIARIDTLRDLIEIGTDALALAAAAVAGKPEGMLAAFKKLRGHVGDYRDEQA